MKKDKENCEAPARVMECALDMGETMLRCGAEILRVEDTVIRICTAYGGGIVDVFTILSLIILSWKADDGENYTLTRRINPYPTDLNKLEELNALSRYICENKPPCDEVERRICAIMAPAKKRIYKSKVTGYVLLASAFTLFFGGSLRDGLAAGVVAVLMYLWDYFFFSARQKPGRVQPCDLHCGGAFVYFICFCGNWTAYRYGDDWQHYAADSRD